MAKKQRKNKSAFWDSITTMPIANWFSMEEKNDMGYLLKRYKKVSAKDIEVLYPAWQVIIDEFIDAFGISDEMKAAMRLRAQIRQCEIEYVLTDDGIHLTEKIIYERQLQGLGGEKKKNDNDRTLMYVNKFMGHWVDKNKVTVKEFFTILKMMNEQAQKQRPEKA